MRLPLILNVNNEVQDQDGVVYARGCDVEFGRKAVELVNAGGSDLGKMLERGKEAGIGADVLHTPIKEQGVDGTATEVSLKKEAVEYIKEVGKKFDRSARMKEIWRQRRVSASKS